MRKCEGVCFSKWKGQIKKKYSIRYLRECWEADMTTEEVNKK